MRLIPTAINMTRTSLSFYSKSVSPLIYKISLPVKKLGYLAGTDVGILSSVLFKSGGTIAQRIMGAERSFIESQGVSLRGDGSLLGDTAYFVASLAEPGNAAFNLAIERSAENLRRIGQVTPFETRAVYRAFSRSINNEALGRPVTRIIKEAKSEIADELNRLGNEVKTLGVSGKREEVSDRIRARIMRVGTAKVDPKNGEINYYGDLNKRSTAMVLGHETGHLIFRSKNVCWDGFHPLTRYGYTSAEEDFCENFSFYMTGYPFYWLLSKVSSKWADRFEIMKKLAGPNSLLPDRATLHFAYERTLGMLLRKNITRIENGIDEGLHKISPKKNIVHIMAFNKNVAKIKKILIQDNHRRALALVNEAGKLGHRSTQTYKGRTLEEHGVDPITISILELIGSLPYWAMACLDSGEGSLINISFLPRQIDPMIWIATPFGISADRNVFIKDPVLDEILSTDPWDMNSRSLRDIHIGLSVGASRLSDKERAGYYKKVESAFGVSLGDSENRAFSPLQTDIIGKLFQGVPKKTLKGLRLIRTFSDDTKRKRAFVPGTIFIDDSMASLFDIPRAFLWEFSTELARQAAYRMAKEKDGVFASFLASGGFAPAHKDLLREAVRIGLGIPKELLFNSNATEDNFLTKGEHTPATDLKDFIYFSAALPDLLDEIAQRNPKIKERLELFRAMVD